jgi:hypothetical protein
VSLIQKGSYFGGLTLLCRLAAEQLLQCCFDPIEFGDKVRGQG